MPASDTTLTEKAVFIIHNPERNGGQVWVSTCPASLTDAEALKAANLNRPAACLLKATRVHTLTPDEVELLGLGDVEDRRNEVFGKILSIAMQEAHTIAFIALNLPGPTQQ